MKQYEFFLTSSLEKVFPDKRPEPLPNSPITILAGEVPAVQLVVFEPRSENQAFDTRLTFDLTVTGAPFPVRLRKVELVPSDFPVYTSAKDENYLRTEPGLFPDLLRPLDFSSLTPVEGQYRAVWIDFPQTGIENHGVYNITVSAQGRSELRLGNGTYILNADCDRQVYSSSFVLKILPAKRPALSLIHTEWFYADCLASVYQLIPFSEEHWRAIENYIRFAAEELDVNMMLTPAFTPPLDTAVGGERPTIQLVDIEKNQDGYRFNFDKLARWCTICRKYDIQYIEVAHLFTQWGAKATPKIVVKVDGELQRMFGWNVPADSPSYRLFLESFLPELRTALQQFGYDCSHVIYHISDEPQEGHMESYKTAKNQVADLLKGCIVVDALSDYAYYEAGLVEHPIPASDCIEPFLEHKVPNLWVYYCCGQSVDVPNRFFSMPSARNRIMGVLLYLYDIKGFLHWGYNFYYSQFSARELNPYYETHGDYAFPSGDAYLVYPGEDWQPLASIRSQVQRSALDDMANLQLLERFIGRLEVTRLIYAEAQGPITFRQYPHDAEFLLKLREVIGREIERALQDAEGT